MMRNQTNTNNEIDILEILRVLLRKAGLIVLAAVLVGALVLGFTVFFVSPTYTASAMMYVNNSSFSVGSTTFSFSASELSAAQSLIDTYSVIAKSRSTLEQVIDELDLDYTYEELYDMVDVGAVDSTEIFSISVSSHSAAEAEMISNKLVELLPDSIAAVVDGSDVRTVELAVIPSKRTSPSYTMNLFIGAFVGALLAAVLVLVRYFMDDIIHSEEYLSLNYPDIPLLAVIPDMTQTAAGGYGYYSHGKKHRHAELAAAEPEEADAEETGKTEETAKTGEAAEAAETAEAAKEE